MSTEEKTIHYDIGYTLRQLRKKRVAVYARVSRDGEVKHHSIEAQMENLKADITKRPDWEFVDFYVDEGISGTKLNRPEFNRMMDDARAGKIDIILTKTVSRLGRNSAALLKVLQELKELDVTVIFDGENINTADPNALFYLQFRAVQAETEARQNSEYQKWAIRNRYKQGIPNNARPYGYVMVDHHLEIVPEEAEVIKRIFTMYLSGMGRQTICKALNSEGILPLMSTKWQQSTICGVLRNEVYVGDLLLQKNYVRDFLTKQNRRNRGELPMYLVQDAHEPIIDRETFEKVQTEIERRKKLHTGLNKRTKQEPRLLSQLIVCGHCGKSLYYKLNHGSAERRLWGCKTHFELGSSHCPVKSIREDILINLTKEILLQENLISENTPLTNQLLKTHIKRIIAKENQELEYRLSTGKVITRTWKNPSRSESWTPEMREAARKRAIIQNAKRKEEKAHV